MISFFKHERYEDLRSEIATNRWASSVLRMKERFVLLAATLSPGLAEEDEGGGDD